MQDSERKGWMIMDEFTAKVVYDAESKLNEALAEVRVLQERSGSEWFGDVVKAVETARRELNAAIFVITAG